MNKDALQKELKDNDGKIIVPENERAKLRQFDFEEFILGQGNFYYHFVDGKSPFCMVYQNTPHYKRFQHNYPDFNSTLREKVNDIFLKKRDYENMKQFMNDLPNPHLYSAYNLMCKLVSIKDKGVVDKEGNVKEDFLIN